MAFEKRNLSLMGSTGVKPSGSDKKGLNFFFYHAGGDDITAAEYFAEGVDDGYIMEDDLIYCPDDNSDTPMVGAVDENGTLQDLDTTPQT